MLHYDDHAGHLHSLLHSNVRATDTVAGIVGVLDAVRMGDGPYLTSTLFDTIVVTGLSGTLIGLPVAIALDVNLAVARQIPGDHSSRMVEGRIGERWVFLDDLICSGDTLTRVATQIAGVAPESVLVGACCYYELDSSMGPWISGADLEERFELARRRSRLATPEKGNSCPRATRTPMGN